MGRVSKKELLGFLESFDEQLGRKIMLVAVGGTAMTLLGIKRSTKDIDFNIPLSEDYKEFKHVLGRIKPGIRIDCWQSNMIFSEILPDDYLELATRYRSGFSKIEVRILNPIDIACSKISRFYLDDMEDIRDCIERFRITKRQLKGRAKQFSQAGSEKVFNQNLEYVLENMF